MTKMTGLLVIAAILAGCSVGPTVPKGQVTVQGRGAEALTSQGDPLLGTGAEEKKVPLEFAKGYAKGISDQVKRTYWAQQESQRTSAADNQGQVKYYNATIPQHEDEDGVVRVQRQVVIPIVE